jgi:uncharacterized protein
LKTKSSWLTSRRTFLANVGGLAVSALATDALAFNQPSASSSTDEPAASPIRPVVKNRTPLTENTFYQLPLGSIRPQGWLKKQLRIQANGMGGHLDETWPDVGPNSGWLGGTGESWERGPYFLDGLIPLAYLLDDANLKAKAQKFVDWTLNNTSADGMIGPRSNQDWWPRMVVLKALTQYHDVTADNRVLPVLSKYFAYQLRSLPQRPLQDWGKYRWQDEELSVIWLFNRTGDSKLLELARLLHEQGYDWPAQFADFKYTERITAEMLKLKPGTMLSEIGMQTHGVNNAQGLKTAPVWSVISGSKQDRAAVFTMLNKLDQFHGQPTGVFAADEHLAGRNPSQGTELCAVVEMMFSLEHALAIVGEPALGDRIERIAYNALPGTFTDDMWAHQYDQQVNQVEVSRHNKPWTTNGPESNLFGLDPNFGCCTANFHQGWPKFAANLWMLSADDGLCAALYAPCNVETIVRGTQVKVVEETEYPFRGKIRFVVNPASRVEFPLRLRIPAWSDNTTILVNGKSIESPRSGSFAVLNRAWNPGDVVELTFRLSVRASNSFNDSVTLERGPLLFSHGIGEGWLKLRDRGMTADWQVFPTTPWNYALKIDRARVEESVSVAESPVGDSPFASKEAPVKLAVRARRLPEWQATDGAADPVPQSPVVSEQTEEQITLVPYAGAKLRITSFPVLKDS